MCVLSIKVLIRKKSGNLFNDPHILETFTSNGKIFTNRYISYLSCGETHCLPSGVRMSPLNLLCKVRVSTKPIRANFLPEHFVGSHCSISHIAKTKGILFEVLSTFLSEDQENNNINNITNEGKEKLFKRKILFGVDTPI